MENERGELVDLYALPWTIRPTGHGTTLHRHFKLLTTFLA